MPVLISGLRTFVAFYLRINDPLPFDGTNPRAWDPRPEIGVVEFKRVTSVKMGSPNDEVLKGHPLWGSGLQLYQAHYADLGIMPTWRVELLVAAA